MSKAHSNIEVDKYLEIGCMRCKYAGTPHCKVLNWIPELNKLREIVLNTGLTEEIKWGVPVYTWNGKNVVTINALKDSANIGFFKGVLLADKYKLLQQQGRIQSDRIIKFTSLLEVLQIADVLQSYIMEAISIEENGKKVVRSNKPETIPEELIQAFQSDAELENAFYKLSPGRQRGYIYFFSQPKQVQTRKKRIQQCRAQILNGLGLNDHYRKQRES